MKKKLVIFNILIITLGLLVMFFTGISVSEKSYKSEAEKNIVTLTKVYVANYNDRITEDVPKNVRVTVVDADCRVKYDSEDDKIIGSEHGDREEIVAAIAGTPKTVTRKSASTGRDTVYYAEKVQTGETFVIVRVSIPVESVKGYVWKIVPTCVWVLASALFVSYVTSILVADAVIKPLKDVKNNLAAVGKGEARTKSKPTGDSEIDEITAEIDGVAQKLDDSVKEANSEKERLDYILDNVSDGIVVIDENGKVEVTNKVADGIFSGAGAVGKDYPVLTADENVLSAIENCVKTRESGSVEFEEDGKTYMVTLNSLDNGYVVLVASDITAVRKGEKMRSEFFANASHELKTPLTAVKGFNDLIALKTNDEEIKEFTRKTDKELSRILTLISDMLDLSRLETQREVKTENINLVDVAEEVKSSLSGLAESKNISVTVSGKGRINAEKEHALELVKNLVENSIRYGNDGGYVKVNVAETDDKTVLTVEDNGVGIEEKHQTRIFERFYRVNKSRSRESGGTGLGLAIVKHVCALYGADINLASVYGAGTKITVTFYRR